MREKSEIFNLKLPTNSGIVDFSVKEGEGLCIIGENGSGKSDLLALLASRGRGVSYRGNRVKLSKDEQALFAVEIGYFDGSGARDNITVGELLERCGTKFNMLPIEVGAVFDIDESEYSIKLSRAEGILAEATGLLETLCRDYKILLIDDVFGLDKAIKARLVPLLKKASTITGVSYIIATTDPDMSALTTHTLLIESGQPVEYGKSENIFKKPAHPYTKWFTSSLKKKKEDEIVLVRTTKDGKPSKKACRFSTICPLADDNCRLKAPDFTPCGRDHLTACYKV